jgi:phosphatidylinositol-3-phosphatase
VSHRPLWLAPLVALMAWQASPLAAAASPPTHISAQVPCGVARTAPTYQHVVWILLENVGYSVVGSSSASYLNSLAARCGLATNYLAISHPSLPNYIALTSGSTQGITDDGEPATHQLGVPSIFSELDGNWRGLVQSMPEACDQVTSGSYAARHNPAAYYVNLGATCTSNDVPLTVPLDLSARFTFITPNICDDMHSCPVAIGDRWLSQIVPDIVASSQYQARSLVLFITFDENDGGSSNQVPTYVVAPSVPRHSRVGVAFTHYSLLRTTETLLGLPFLGAARSATSMVSPFHL